MKRKLWRIVLALASAVIPAETPASSIIGETSASSSVQVAGLKAEHIREPLGLQTAHPRFRWLLQSNERGQLQTAYQILVASRLDDLNRDIGDKWDSGRIESDNSVETVYQGHELVSGERAYWKVRVWDSLRRPSGYSAPTFFEMGLQQPSDWKGKWIAARKGISSPIFRREFSIAAAVRRARLYICGLGYYELSINGQRVGDRVLEPASSYYHNDLPSKLGSRVLYSTYDVTEQLRSGANVVGVMLGHGAYSAEADTIFRVAYGVRPRFILQMNIELENGRTVTIVSDASWKGSSSPITYNDIANGESYDARLEQAGWDMPGFNESAWANATLVAPPSGTLTAQLLPPGRVMQTLPVVKMLTPKVAEFFENTQVYDFGQNFTGWVRISVSGPRGAKLVLRYGSRIYPEDGTLDTRSNEPPIEPARQADTYILKGDGTEVWEPRFTLHAFRYVEIRSSTDTPLLRKIEGRFVRSAVAQTGSFVSSNELLNKIHHNIQWSFMSSFQGIPQDAAERAERVGWLGDPGFVGEDFIYNYDMLGFWEKWLDDLADCQDENGSIPIMCPDHWRGRRNRVWPSWQSTYPLLVWYLYEYYGDRQVVEKHYASIQKLVDYLSHAAEGHLITEESLGDHMEPQEEGFSTKWSQHTPTGLSATAYYYYEVMLLSRMAKLLGRADDAQRYDALAGEIRTAFNRKFFDPGTEQYGTGSQTSNALPLHLGLVPQEEIAAVTRNLVDDILKHEIHVSTGIVGTNAIVQALPQYGQASLMYKLAIQTSYPSLGYQVGLGATTLCESYECNPWLSQNMKMLGSLDKFFYRDLAGIRPASPGYRRVVVMPQPLGDLQNVSASEQTVRGVVGVDWIKNEKSFDLKVSIPAGMEADLVIPNLGLRDLKMAEGAAVVWDANAYVPGTAGLFGATANDNSIVFHAGSGSYHFIVTGAR